MNIPALFVSETVNFLTTTKFGYATAPLSCIPAFRPCNSVSFRGQFAFEIDDVIDPPGTRSWVMAGLRSLPLVGARAGKKRPFVDTW